MSDWISCKDRLPTKTGIYPACSMHPQRTFEAENWIEMLYEFDADAKRGETPWQHGSGFYDGAITHWMDLPEAPK
ncbi:DUF551 domain-containing protein [Pseudomonas sp. dw_612]|uniref:DUF551 domain-containing protein n=1 Tax=Pseudomonas sp. dw_612 TaxID=2720080 RepID=UPI001BD32990|nr:DUF551 domain-containing protein [Pseudomonas sp. dw_612]